jgi:hypothetical protein
MPDPNHEPNMMQVESTTLGKSQNSGPTREIMNTQPQNEPLASKVNKLAEEIRRLGKAEKNALLKKLIPGLTIANTVELEDPSIWVCALHPEALYISNQNSMNVPFIFENVHGKAEEHMLLDSGATENFMDQRMISRLKIGTKQLPAPRKVHNVDSTENWSGTITEYCSLRIWIGTCEALQQFFITDLGRNRAIFGYPWLKFFNPKVNWTQGALEEPPVQVETSLFKWWKKYQSALKACVEARSVGEGKRAHIVRTNLSQQWAEEANKDKAARENSELPAKYQ